MRNETSLAIEFKLGNITPWTIIYRTNNTNDLKNVWRYLTTEKRPDYNYRCSVYLGGSYRPISYHSAIDFTVPCGTIHNTTRKKKNEN